ncbi:MAG: hypothetical protein ACQKBV_03295, partial [Puniceicoccales bacterium]
KRGFLKLYGRYLKLDIDKLMTDFDAAMLGRSKVKRSDAREFFGRMDLPERTTPLGSKDSTPPFGQHEQEERAPAEPSSSPAESMEQQTDTSLYWKIGAIFVGTFVIVGLLALLVQTIFSGGSDSDTDTGDGSAIVSNGGSSSGNAGSGTPGEVTLIGLGDTNVIVKELNDLGTSQDDVRIEDASGSISAGEEITFSRRGPIVVVSTAIENVAVRIDGQTYRPGDMSGLRKWYFNDEGPFNPYR